MSTDLLEKPVSETVEGISLSDRAAAELREVIEQQGKDNLLLRIWVSGGGCSGLQYGMRLEEGEPEEDDVLFNHDGIKVVVDSFSLQYMPGATVEYVDDGLESGFRISNPNATSSCGCGNSFQTAGSGGGCSSGGCGSCGSR